MVPLAVQLQACEVGEGLEQSQVRQGPLRLTAWSVQSGLEAGQVLQLQQGLKVCGT